jgi:hypothetical protein
MALTEGKWDTMRAECLYNGVITRFVFGLIPRVYCAAFRVQVCLGLCGTQNRFFHVIRANVHDMSLRMIRLGNGVVVHQENSFI